MYATIQPVPAFPKPAVALSINNVTVFPGQSAAFGWHLFDEDKSQVGFGTINLTGEAYTAWGSNDDYLYTYTAQQLGLTIIEIVPDAPATVAPVAPPAPADPVAPAVDAPAAPVASSEPAQVAPQT